MADCTDDVAGHGGMIDLPEELLLEIVKQLDLFGLLSFAQICRRFRRLIATDTVSKDLLIKRFRYTEYNFRHKARLRQNQFDVLIDNLSSYAALYHRKAFGYAAAYQSGGLPAAYAEDLGLTPRHGHRATVSGHLVAFWYSGKSIAQVYDLQRNKALASCKLPAGLFIRECVFRDQEDLLVLTSRSSSQSVLSYDVATGDLAGVFKMKCSELINISYKFGWILCDWAKKPDNRRLMTLIHFDSGLYGSERVDVPSGEILHSTVVMKSSSEDYIFAPFCVDDWDSGPVLYDCIDRKRHQLRLSSLPRFQRSDQIYEGWAVEKELSTRELADERHKLVPDPWWQVMPTRLLSGIDLNCSISLGWQSDEHANPLFDIEESDDIVSINAGLYIKAYEPNTRWIDHQQPEKPTANLFDQVGRLRAPGEGDSSELVYSMLLASYSWVVVVYTTGFKAYKIHRLGDSNFQPSRPELVERPNASK
ncbi:hypothetical protein PYCC9005_004281 [Savitreella phatthalungensis]